MKAFLAGVRTHRKKMLEKACVLVMLFALANCQDYLQPEQLHLSYPDDPTKMVVTWSTMTNTNSSICEYGQTSLDKKAEGYRTLFIDGGEHKRQQIIHRVVLTDLAPGKKYWYHCGSDWGWSDLFFFKAIQSGSNWSPKFALFGDMGNVNGMSVPYLQKETQNGDYDAIVHVGDFAYDMDTNDALVGDEFMKQIEPIAAYAPYMTCVGNHEQMYNFSNYKNRFTMPNDNGNMFFSYNIGPVHFIAVSTEFYFFTNYGFKQIVNQYKWLEEDLINATTPENRAKQPWIIIYGHRPMYCSNNDDDDCTHKESVVRIGIPVLHLYGMEVLLYKYGVDLAFWAHEHSYERLWPVFNRTVVNGSMNEPYTNPRATVHLTTGSAGCQEKLDPFTKDSPPWTAFRDVEYGYTKIQAFNSTHLHLEQVAVEQGKVIDSIWLIKNKHDSFLKLYPGQFQI